MKKSFILILICLVGMSVQAVTLKGGVSYTVESARKEAFANVEYSLPQSIIDANRVDPNFRQNKRLIKDGVKETEDRFITYFSDGGYGIVYKNNLYYEYSYLKNGKLDSIGKRTGLIYPTKCYTFTAANILDSVTLYVKKGETYIFNPNGELGYHWIEDKCFDTNGKLILKSY